MFELSPGEGNLPPGVTDRDIERAMGGLCPECDRELPEDATVCFDCSAGDYFEGHMEDANYDH